MFIIARLRFSAKTKIVIISATTGSIFIVLSSEKAYN